MAEINTLTTNAAIGALLPLPAPDANKFSRGNALIIAGSQRYAGAAVLATLAATRAGAGYVTLATIPPVAAAMRPQLPTVPVVEIAATPHPSKYDHNTGILASKNTFDTLLELATNANSVLIGPGLGRDPELMSFVRSFVQKIAENDTGPKLVLDADALFAFSGEDLFEFPRKYPIVLTPHPIELKRLTGSTDPTSGLVRALTEHNFTVVAKSPDTHILSEGRYDVDETGPPSLATAGSGDVLAGMLAALLAQGLKRHEAAVSAVRLQALAALVAEDELTPLCVNARDLIDYIPVAASILLEEGGARP